MTNTSAHPSRLVRTVEAPAHWSLPARACHVRALRHYEMCVIEMFARHRVVTA
jgi:hypothetical protein